MSAPTYRFVITRSTWRDDPYYVCGSNYVHGIEVLASTTDEATSKVIALSPELRRGWHYRCSVTSISEVAS